MFKEIKELIDLLSAPQRKQLFTLQLLVIFMAISEMISIFSIGPFMAVIANNDLITSNPYLNYLYTYFSFSDNASFIFSLAALIIIIMITAASISMFCTWRLAHFAQKIGAEISMKLYNFYLHEDWLFHSCNNSADLVSKVGVECNRLTNTVINQILMFGQKIFLVLLITMGILIYNPAVGLIGFSLIAVSYVILFNTVRKNLLLNGQNVSKANKLRTKLMQEGFGGIKDLLLNGRQESFTQRYQDISKLFAASQGNTVALAQMPRYILELIAFVSVLLLIMYFVSNDSSSLATILPTLAIYSVAGLKLLPAFQQIYASVASMRANLASFRLVKDDLKEANLFFEQNLAHDQKITFCQQIEIKDLSFGYPVKDNNVINNLSFKINKNQMIGIVGPSGSGKSTLVDLIIGLIEPSDGEILVDNKKLVAYRNYGWKKNIGYVQQNIFLIDDSIQKNIAFGIPVDEIDSKKLNNAIKMANLEELIANLPNGLETNVGERGVQLSGGQKQRIGIARALYNDPEILIFDEATSALDGISEKSVMKALDNFASRKTMIMIAHRLSTVKNCDQIYVLKEGKIEDSGTYDELMSTNKTFQAMSNLSKKNEE
tara:strand:+ start:5765 stop:7573 length:1809 start_codon:yes stop_codon:yes gene_type:complete